MYWKTYVDTGIKLSERAKLLADVLSKQPGVKLLSVHVAREIGIKGRSVDRTIRALCQHLAMCGVPILGDDNGIWISVSADEVRTYIDRRLAEAQAAYKSTQLRLAMMELTANKMAWAKPPWQASLFGGGE